MKRLAMLLLIVIAATLAACTIGATRTPEAEAPTATPEAPPANAVRVDVTLVDNTIESSLTTFQTGIPYTFVITNNGPHAHDFNISQPVSVVGSLDAALKGALLVVPQKELGPGSTATVQFTFPDSALGLKLEFSCLIRRHYDDGMMLAITLEK